MACPADPEYGPYAKSRLGGSVGTLVAIDDSDVAGTIPYLKKAN